MTNTPWAPWIIVEGTDDRYRSLTVGKIMLDALQKRLADKATRQCAGGAADAAEHRRPRRADAHSTSRRSWPRRPTRRSWPNGRASSPNWCATRASRSARWCWSSRARTPPARAAASGASPRRSTRASTRSSRSPRPPRRSAPSPTSGASGGTFRAPGRVAIFDRSWYGRVLVERVEGFCAEADWLRAYSEINDFEHQLAEAGAIVMKFWLQISHGGAAAALQGAREDRASSASRSPRRTGATARSGTPTTRPSATWSTAPAPGSRRGRWSRPTTRTTPGSRC